MNYTIKVQKVTKYYGKKKILKGIDLNVKSGSLYGLVGANGAGKTTLFKIILALTAKDDGDFFIFNNKINGYRDIPYHRIGNMIETPVFYPNLTARENLETFAKLKGKKNKNSIRDALDLVDLPNDDTKLFSQYSLGMKQRLGLANAIFINPELLILDEPINGLDPMGIVDIRKILLRLNKERKTTILLSSHILSEIEEIADYIGIIRDGTLIEECPIGEIFNKSKKNIVATVSSVQAATLVLEKKFKIFDYKVIDNETINIYTENYRSEEINKAMVNQGIDVKEIMTSSKNSRLEKYFLELVGEAE